MDKGIFAALSLLIGINAQYSSAHAQVSGELKNLAGGYVQVPEDKNLLSWTDLSKAKDIDVGYVNEFYNCDGKGAADLKDYFRGISLWRKDRPIDKQYNLCSKDPSNLNALLKLNDGAILWQSKMALDVDGSDNAWNGAIGQTDSLLTAYKWPNVLDKKSKEAQINPDKIPYVVIPIDGLAPISGNKSKELGAEFRNLTNIKLGDIGLVIYKGKWTPAIVADGGAFEKIGEGSTRVFENLGESRCKGWNKDNSICIGNGTKYPYKNFGIANNVTYIFWPNSGNPKINDKDALTIMCKFVEEKTKLKGSVCKN